MFSICKLFKQLLVFPNGSKRRSKIPRNVLNVMLPLMSSYLIYHLFFPTSLQRIGSLKVQSGLNSFPEVKRQSQKQQKQFSLQSWNLGEPALKAHFVDRLDIVVLWHDWVILCHFLQATNRTCAEDVCCSARNQENENDKEKKKKRTRKKKKEKNIPKEQHRQLVLSSAKNILHIRFGASSCHHSSA